MTGWGFTGVTTDYRNHRDRFDRFGRLQFVERFLKLAMMRVFPDQKCSQNPNYIKEGIRMQAGKVCAGAPGNVDACRGDSGGPLVWKRAGLPLLIGLVSNGPGCGLDDTPGLYADVRFHAKLIDGAKHAVRTGRVIRW